MVMNYQHQEEIQDPHHHLPEDLQQYNATEITVEFWDQNDGLTSALSRKVTLSEGGLYQSDDLIPVGGVRCVFLIFCTQPKT